MRCAVYLRRSTEEHQAASLNVQLEEARRYIAAKGWTLLESSIFRDDAVSRAEFKKRPGLWAMLAAARSRVFDVVVLRDETRLGGDMFRTMLALSDIIEAGVRVFYYAKDEEVTLEGPTEKMIQAVRGYAAELERNKVSERTREHLLTKARRGLNVGGRAFGYDNCENLSGERRDHVDFRINEREAAIVVELFSHYAAGQGLRTIVKDLNSRGVAKPRIGKRGTGSWSTSAVWTMLRNERYRGVLTWGRTEKTYRGGTKVRLKRERAQWTQAERPDLRIVPEELWFAVQARIAESKRIVAPKGGRPPRYLLSGLCRCGECGGPLTVANHKIGSEVIKVYTCAYHRERGNAVCTNTSRRPVAAVNDAILTWIRTHVLTEPMMEAVLTMVRSQLAERHLATTASLPELEGERRRIQAEVDRLVRALAVSDENPAPVVSAIAARQQRLAELDARLKAAAAEPRAIQLEGRRMEAEARRRLGELRGAFERNPAEARRVMSALFEGPLRCSPIETAEGRRFQIEGTASIGKMLVTEFSNSASPTGFEPVSTVADGR